VTVGEWVLWLLPVANLVGLALVAWALRERERDRDRWR
jgi:hypothetical protein